MTTSVIIDAWRAGTTAQLPHLMSEDVVFSSPVADYPGRTSAGHILTLIARTLERIEPTDAWMNHQQVVAAFTAQVGDAGLEGMIREQFDAAGLLMHVTLYLRPYLTLRQAIARMLELLKQYPMPSTSP